LVTTQEVGAATGFAVMIAIAAYAAGGAATPDALAEGYRWAILAAALIAAGGGIVAGLMPRGHGGVRRAASPPKLLSGDAVERTELGVARGTAPDQRAA